MPYPTAVDGPALVNYRSAPRPDDAAAFSSRAHGDPATPILKAYAGDPMRVHVIGAPGSEQPHVFSLGGLSWSTDPHSPNTSLVSAQGFGAWESIDAIPEGGAGGWARMRGDMFVGDLRRPFTQAGMWGLMRVLSDAEVPDPAAPGRDCVGEDPIGSSPATPIAPGTAPTTGTIRAGTQPLQTPSHRSTRPARPHRGRRGSATSCCRPSIAKPQLRRGVRLGVTAPPRPGCCASSCDGPGRGRPGRDRAGHSPAGGRSRRPGGCRHARSRACGPVAHVVTVGARTTGPRLTARMGVR